MIFIKDSNSASYANTVVVSKFPDGTQCLRYQHDSYTDPLKYSNNTDALRRYNSKNIDVLWCYDTEEELFQLYALKRYIDELNNTAIVNLIMPYIPNARFDRVVEKDEIFTLKYFCEIINSLHFNKVKVFDPHSNVSAALINNISIEYPSTELLSGKVDDFDVVFYPDEGALKRYTNIGIYKNKDVAFGIKQRDWRTGQIKSLRVESDIDLKGKRVLIIDDICSKGGTFYYSAKALKELGVSSIQLYVSHCENTIFRGELLKTELIAKIYTTNSIYRGENKKIEVIKEF